MKPSLPVRIKISSELLAMGAVILFFASAFFRAGFQFVLHNDQLGLVISTALPYVAVLMLCIWSPTKYLRFDFIILMLLILTFFWCTLVFHPNYLPFYQKENFGVWDHVLAPYRGIYAFLFIRLLKDPKKIMSAMRAAGYLMLLYYVWRVYNALRTGYWTGVGENGMAKMSYSVTFGYEVLPFASFFLYAALTDRKLIDIGMSALLIVMILIGGSRGPVLFLGICVVLYMMITIQNSRKKFLLIGSVLLASVLLALFYRNLLQAAIAVANHFGFSSRFLVTMLEGTVTDDNNRGKIWAAAIQMIKDNPFGYGAMGSRHIIERYIYAGYPHNVILEILIDFGVLFGSMILIGLLVCGWRILFNPKYSGWRPLAVPFFSTTCSLMVSMTYWSVPYFWVSVAIIISGLQYSGNNSVLSTFIADLFKRRQKSR